MTAANKVTLLRVIMIPAVIAFMYVDAIWAPFAAAVLFALAAASDFIDGYLARSRGEVTNFGKFLDPIADKMLVAAAMLILCEQGALPAWTAVLVIIREFAVSGLRLIAAEKNQVMAADKLGKIKTVLQDVALTILIMHNWPFGSVPVGIIIWYAATAMTVISGINYFIKNASSLKG